MSRKVVVTEADALPDAARRSMQRHRIRQLPVVRKKKLVGIVTDRDLRSAAPGTKKVADVMTAKPFTISPRAAVDEAARLLRAYKIGALPVVDGKDLVGIVTASDILEAFVDLSGVAEPSYRLSLAVRGVRQVEARIRRAAENARAELKWMHRDIRQRPPRIHLRVRARRIEDLVTALEADGLEVLSTVSSSTAPR